MRVSEIFYSLQGEGFLAGVPSVFVRVAGCRLRCRWCDTKYAWDEAAGTDYSIGGIIEAVRQWPSRFVVVTGGEPMINDEVPGLVRRLKGAGKHVTVETAGIAYIADMPCDLTSISPKLSNSVPDERGLADVHEHARLNISVLGELIEHYDYQLKFVVESADDLAEIRRTIEDIGNVDAEKVMLMPQGRTREELLARSAMVAEMCKSSGFAFCQRLQVVLYDGRRGT
jgi:7-carboxy-7-deazaguanine synthase